MRHKNPERVAWFILWGAFLACVVLGVGTPLGIRWLLLFSTVPRSAGLQVLSGTILLRAPGTQEPLGVTAARPVPVGSAVSTDATSLGLLTLAVDGTGEQVFGTVQLYNDTALQLLDARVARFSISRRPPELTLHLERGLMRLVTSNTANPGTRAEVRTPHGTALLDVGSYSILVANLETQITVRAGQAEVIAGGTSVILTENQRTSIRVGGTPTSPVDAPQNLIVNGDFSAPLVGAWQAFHAESVGPNSPAIAGTVDRGQVAGRQAVTFFRQAGDGIHSETGIKQVIERNVRDFESLALRLDVRLEEQSLEGAGSLSSEFPLMVRLDYTDIYGKSQFWVHGFYYRDISPERSTWFIVNGEKVTQGVWFFYESGNLLELFQQLSPPLPPPGRIDAITIYASGHDYHSRVAQVELIAQ